MAITLAREYKTKHVVYIGSSFNNNQLLREVVENYTVLRGFKPYYIENGAFSGALGALTSNRKWLEANWYGLLLPLPSNLLYTLNFSVFSFKHLLISNL